MYVASNHHYKVIEKQVTKINWNNYFEICLIYFVFYYIFKSILYFVIETHFPRTVWIEIPFAVKYFRMSLQSSGLIH